MTSRATAQSTASTMWKVAKPQARNLVRGRWLACYVIFFSVVAEGLLRLTGEDSKTLLSIGNIVLYVVPLVTLVYGTIYLYNSREFIELLLAQPLKRRTVFAGLYLGIAAPLAVAFSIGTALPFAVHGISVEEQRSFATILVGGSALTLVFTGIAFWIAVRFEDRLTGLGAAIATWLAFALVYDGVILFVVAILSDHSIEKPLLIATLANPVDLVRIALLLQFDVSALMGYTGAVFSRFFSETAGLVLVAAALSLWIVAPFTAGFVAFRRKDF